jgi:putative flippase GtrA
MKCASNVQYPCMDKKEHNRSLASLFVKAQLAAVLATLADFVSMIFLKEVLGVWYVTATAIGAFVGATTNFLLNRYGVFLAGGKSIKQQVSRYAIVAAGSLLLNTGGVFLITEYLNIPYLYSRVIVAVLVAFTYNFYLQKNFVFK